MDELDAMGAAAMAIEEPAARQAALRDVISVHPTHSLDPHVPRCRIALGVTQSRPRELKDEHAMPVSCQEFCYLSVWVPDCITAHILPEV
jgi:hypothetical protein